MKVQIRRHVFETNSSSVHTLSICKEDPIDIAKYAGTTFYFGKSWTERKEDDYIQEKIDTIFFYMVSNDSLSNFIRCKNMIEKVFSKYEIKCEYLIDENGEYVNEGDDDDVLDYLFDSNNPDFEDDLICFIFNKKSQTDYFDNNYFDDTCLPKGNFKNYYIDC